jgi:hypothetical protein
VRIGISLYQVGIPGLRARITAGRYRSSPQVLREAVVPRASDVAVLLKWCAENGVDASAANIKVETQTQKEEK